LNARCVAKFHFNFQWAWSSGTVAGSAAAST
jgi:predicted flavoprotein YhiN